MSATGIGASVKRKEDQRFITGKGQYTDDINRPGQAYAVFVRSPHAHADHQAHRYRGGLEVAGLHCRVHRRGYCKGQGRRPDLRLDDPLQGRLADESRRAPRAGARQGALRRRPRRDGDRRDAGGGQGRRRAGGGRVRRRFRPSSTLVRRRVPASRSSMPKRQATPSISGTWATRPRSTRPSPAPSTSRRSISPTTGWCPTPSSRARRSANTTRRGEPDALHHQPEPARHPASARGLHRLRARAQAARHRSRCRRRLRLQDLHLCRGDGVPVGRAQGRPAGEVDRRIAPKLSSPMRTAAIIVTSAELALDADGKILALRANTKANLGAYLSTFASSVPTYLYAPLLSGQYNIPAIYCEVDGVYTNTAPVDAYRGAGRPEATFVVERLVEMAARETGPGPGRVPAQELHHGVSAYRRPSSWPTTPATTKRAWTRLSRWRTTRASPRARRRAPRRARSAASASRPISRLAASPRARPSARSAPASACGNRRRCASIPPARSRC